MAIKLINRETVYRTKIFSIEAVLLEFPAGRRVGYDLIKHNPSVTILPVDTEGMIYMVRQFRLGAEQELLELPAGVVEDGEDPQDCALRELREEIGLSSKKLRLLGQAYLIPGYGDELMHFYLAEELVPSPLKADPDEYIKIEKYTAVALFDLVDGGHICDSKTLAALTLARQHLSSLY
jgi:ADP-ribose pyrophosphatase